MIYVNGKALDIASNDWGSQIQLSKSDVNHCIEVKEDVQIEGKSEMPEVTFIRKSSSIMNGIFERVQK